MINLISPNECQKISGLAVVIDVLRAFTVAPMALDQGAREIVLVGTLQEALQRKAANPDALAFKDGPPERGFDLLNSPKQLLDLDVTDRTIFQKTTAGTRAVFAACHCAPLLCASFVCASATARYLRACREAPTFVISGAQGNATEDIAAAQFISALIKNPDTDPSPYLQAATQSEAAQQLREGIKSGYVGIDPEDIAICLEVDRVDFCLIATASQKVVTLQQAQLPA